MKNLSIFILVLFGHIAIAQTCLLNYPTKVTRKSKVESLWWKDDEIYVKLISTTYNQRTGIYVFTSDGQTKTITEIKSSGLVDASKWYFKPGDKIEVWEKNTILSDTRVLSYTFTNADKNASDRNRETSKYKISIKKGCF